MFKAVQAAVWKDRVDGFFRGKGSKLGGLPIAPWLRCQSFRTEYNAIVIHAVEFGRFVHEPRALYLQRVQKGKFAFANRRAFEL